MTLSKDTSAKPQVADPLNPGEQPTDRSLDVGAGSDGSGSIADEFSRSVNAALSGIGDKITEVTGVQLGSGGGGASDAPAAAAPDPAGTDRTAYEAKDEQVQDFLRDQYRSTAGDGLEKK